MKLRLVMFVTALGLSACGIGDVGKERRLEDDELNLTSAECNKVKQNGCIQGQVISAPDIFVKGTKFFDADELAQKFKSMLDVQSSTNAKVAAKDFSLTWITKLDNKNFVQDFQVFLKGVAARQADVLHNGSFALSYLREGTYDLRVQKVFKFELSPILTIAKAQIEPVTVEGSTPATTVKEEPQPEVSAVKTYCVTFFSIMPVDVKKDFRTTGIVVDQFDFEVKSCDKAEKDQPITL